MSDQAIEVEAKVVDPSEIDNNLQLTSSNELIKNCLNIYNSARKNDLVWRWLLGKQIEQIYLEEKKYESGILKRLSNELDIAISDLSRFHKFYNKFSDVKNIESAADKGFTWSHFKAVNDLPDGNTKQALITSIEQAEKAPKTTEFQKEISQKREQQLDRAATDQANSSSGGGGSATDKKKSNSPSRPVNKALTCLDNLGDYLGDLIIILDEGVEFDDDKKQEAFTEKLAELKTRLNEIIEYRDKINDLTT